jgi:hypothetical protein
MSEPLRLEPGVGERAAALCDSASAELASLAAQLGQGRCGEDNRWLGDCEEGRGWHRLLLQQSASLRRVLDGHAEQLTVFAGRFRAAEAAYRDADLGVADRYPS